MKKTLKLENLDCANCALKIENAVAKLDNVTDVKVNFLSQKMVIESPDDKFVETLKEVKKVAKKIEPDVVIE